MSCLFGFHHYFLIFRVEQKNIFTNGYKQVEEILILILLAAEQEG
jgi:hypothetical protein